MEGQKGLFLSDRPRGGIIRKQVVAKFFRGSLWFIL